MTAIILCVIAFTVFAVFMLAWSASDRRAEEERRGWRLRCFGAGSWAYEEKRNGEWVGVTFEETTDFRESPHTIDVRPERWTAFPSWAIERREEILVRMRSQLKRPQYVIEEV